jgi:peptidyl-dipeptidase A
MATLADVDRVTREPYTRWKAALDERLASRFATTPDRLAPWHYDDPFLQSPPVAAGVDLDPFFAGRDLLGRTLDTFDALGLDVRAIAERSDLFPRPGKNQHAFCVDIDREGDVRVLGNVTDTEQWMETLLHEFGHATYFAELDRAVPWLLRTMHPLLTEGVAMMFGRLTRDPDWLTEVAGVPGREVDAVRDVLAEQLRAGLLVFARWVLVMTTFERDLYRDPERDLGTHWWDLVERYQQVRRPSGPRPSDWASKIHVALTPVYYQHYLYGEMFASQLGAWLRRAYGGIVRAPDAGRALRERVFCHGSTLRWDRLVEQATGAPLDAAHLGADIGL